MLIIFHHDRLWRLWSGLDWNGNAEVLTLIDSKIKHVLGSSAVKQQQQHNNMKRKRLPCSTQTPEWNATWNCCLMTFKLLQFFFFFFMWETILTIPQISNPQMSILHNYNNSSQPLHHPAHAKFDMGIEKLKWPQCGRPRKLCWLPQLARMHWSVKASVKESLVFFSVTGQQRE